MTDEMIEQKLARFAPKVAPYDEEARRLCAELMDEVRPRASARRRSGRALVASAALLSTVGVGAAAAAVGGWTPWEDDPVRIETSAKSVDGVQCRRTYYVDDRRGDAVSGPPSPAVQAARRVLASIDLSAIDFEAEVRKMDPTIAKALSGPERRAMAYDYAVFAKVHAELKREGIDPHAVTLGGQTTSTVPNAPGGTIVEACDPRVGNSQ